MRDSEIENTVKHRGSIVMPNKQKKRIEEKVRIIRKYLKGEINLSEGAREAGVDIESLRNWIHIYESEGVEGFVWKGNKKYSIELKTAAVLDYQQGGGSLQSICAKHKIKDKETLRAWIKVYNAHGDLNSVKHSGGGSYMKQGRETTQEERLEIVKDWLASGKNYGAMALKYNVSYQQVRTWTLRFEELGKAGLEDRRGKRKKDQEPRTELEAAQIEIERLKHQLYLTEMERDLLKKLDEIERRDASHK